MNSSLGHGVAEVRPPPRIKRSVPYCHERNHMELAQNQISACRLELPQFYFVDIYHIPKIRRQQILSGFTVRDLENKATEQSIADALDNLTK